MKNKVNENSIKVSLLAIDKTYNQNIIQPVETENRGQFINWGDLNAYPQYLFELYNTSPTLHSIIEGVADYVVGNGVETNVFVTDEMIRDCAISYALYGGIALNILRNRFGGIAQIVVLDFKKVRSNKNNTVFYYSDDFGTKKWGRAKCITIPAFDPNDKFQPSSIYYYKLTKHTTYPSPMWAASVPSAECERQIANFHLNSIMNGFSANILLSFNNGIPTDEVKRQIEENISQKFCGSENAATPVISYSNDKEHAPEIIKIDTDSFADRYNALSTKSQRDLFTSFRANANLFGIPTENNGFNSEEYESSFKLFNRFTIKPIQNIIINIMKDLNIEITIKPFSFE